jgi:hypothetical protein
MTTYQPRQLAVGDLLDEAFRIYRSNFLTFVSITAIALVPLALLYLFSFATLGDAVAVDYFQAFVITNLLSPALCGTVMLFYQGQQPDFGAAYGIGAQRMLAVFGTNILLGLIVVLPIALLAGFAIFAGLETGRGMGLVVVIAILLLIPLLIYLSVRLLLVVPVIVIESRSGWQAIARSWALTRGFFWRIVGIALLTGLLIFLIAELPVLFVGAFFGVSDGAMDLRMFQGAAVVVAQVGQIIALPIQWAIYTLFYYDLRVRNEGYDLELLAQQIAPSPFEQR